MKSDKGFNLLELLIVIAILGIIAGIAAPNLANLVRKGRIENQTRRIYADLANTRVMAMNRNMMHFFRFAGNSYTVYADESNNGGNYQVYDTGDKQVLQRSGLDRVPLTFSGTYPGNENVSGTQVSFNSRGYATPLGSTICIGDATVVSQPSVNCVVVTTTRIRMGQITNANLAAGNCSGNCNAIQ